jgi:UDP-N-acetyl-2-amino-2-deoxyglucuronate dehydrogenase
MAELKSAYDILPARTNAFCNEFGITVSKTLEDLLHNHEIDIVNICTPNGTHYALSIAALNCGKHVLVEKPMALCRKDCEEMIRAAEANNRELFVVKQNRFNPPVQELRKLIEGKKLGKIYMVSVNCFWNRNEEYYRNSDWKGKKDLDGGALFTQFSHFIDIFYYLFGEIREINGMVANEGHKGLIEFEDTGCFTFRFNNGALGSLSFTTTSYKQNMEGSITVFAENATIKIGGKYLNTIEYQKTNGFDINGKNDPGLPNHYGHYEGSMSNHDKVIHNVIETLNKRETIMTNAREGMKVVEMIEKFYAATGNKNV